MYMTESFFIKQESLHLEEVLQFQEGLVDPFISKFKSIKTKLSNFIKKREMVLKKHKIVTAKHKSMLKKFAVKEGSKLVKLLISGKTKKFYKQMGMSIVRSRLLISNILRDSENNLSGLGLQLARGLLLAALITLSIVFFNQIVITVTSKMTDFLITETMVPGLSGLLNIMKNITVSIVGALSAYAIVPLMQEIGVLLSVEGKFTFGYTIGASVLDGLRYTSAGLYKAYKEKRSKLNMIYKTIFISLGSFLVNAFSAISNATLGFLNLNRFLLPFLVIIRAAWNIGIVMILGAGLKDVKTPPEPEKAKEESGLLTKIEKFIGKLVDEDLDSSKQRAALSKAEREKFQLKSDKYNAQADVRAGRIATRNAASMKAGEGWKFDIDDLLKRRNKSLSPRNDTPSRTYKISKKTPDYKIGGRKQDYKGLVFD